MAVPLLDLPRDPQFTVKAGRILDLYGGRWEGELLHPGDYVVCCDEKPSIQARARKHPTTPANAAVKRGQRVEHEYERREPCATSPPGTPAAPACSTAAPPRTGSSRSTNWSTSSCLAALQAGAARVRHRRQRVRAPRSSSIDRLQGTWSNLILVHTPVHASWLNQAEIYFSIVQRKVVTPNDFPDLNTLEQQLLAFGRRYEQIAQPFEWKFTRADLDRLAERLDLPAAQAA